MCKKQKGQLLRKLVISSVFTEYSYVIKERAVNNWFFSSFQYQIMKRTLSGEYLVWQYQVNIWNIYELMKSKYTKRASDHQFWFCRSNLANSMQNKEKCNSSPTLKLWKGTKSLLFNFHLIYFNIYSTDCVHFIV